MHPVLDLCQLVKRHASGGATFTVRVPRLRVPPGRALGIVGPSGCGKSTVLETLALLNRPDRAARFRLSAGGRAYDVAALWARNDRNALAALRAAHVGFVHQAGCLLPFLNVRDNIRLPLRLLGRAAAPEARRRADELIDLLGLERLLAKLPAALSYGERQRAAIARALVHAPALLLADEPTSALDPESARTVMRLLADGAGLTGTTLLVVSHDTALLAAAGVPVLRLRPDVEEKTAGAAFYLDVPERAPASPPAAVPAFAPPGPAETQRAETPTSPVPRPRPGPALSLAWTDFRRERALSVCGVLGFAAALAPFLILLSLRLGLVDTLTRRFLADPRALAVTPYGSRRYTEADIAAMRAWPSVAFVVPTPRALAATVTVSGPDGRGATADLLPTAPGDPLLARYGADAAPGGANDGAVITRHLARSLPHVEEGGELTVTVTRRYRDRLEKATFPLRLRAILPDAAGWQPQIFADLAWAERVERWRDGFAVPDLGWSGDEPPVLSGSTKARDRSYAGFRLYAVGPDDVVRLRDRLKTAGVDVYTRADEVENIQNLRRILFLVTALVGGVALAGATLSLASLAVSGVGRKARVFAQLRLMGLPTSGLLLFPLVQAGLTALAATGVALGVYGAASTGLNRAFAAFMAEGEGVCRLPPDLVLTVFIGASALACLSGVAAGLMVSRLPTAEVLRRDA